MGWHDPSYRSVSCDPCGSVFVRSGSAVTDKTVDLFDAERRHLTEPDPRPSLGRAVGGRRAQRAWRPRGRPARPLSGTAVWTGGGGGVSRRELGLSGSGGHARRRRGWIAGRRRLSRGRWIEDVATSGSRRSLERAEHGPARACAKACLLAGRFSTAEANGTRTTSLW